MQAIRLYIWWIFAGLLILNFFVWIMPLATKAEAVVSFLDIGQGDSIYAKFPNGTDMLIDGGKSADVLAEVLRSALSFSDKRLDVVMATHPDADHVGGLSRILDTFEVGALIISPNYSKTDTYDRLLESAGEKNIPTIEAAPGLSIKFSSRPAISMTVLAPMGEARFVESNGASIVGKLLVGEHSYLLTGDAPLTVEEKLVEVYGNNLASDVLKLGHHGSHTSSGRKFLETVAPNVAIISAGKNNSYGHPHKEVLENLSLLQIPYLGTYQKGTIICSTDGEKMKCR